MTMSQGSERSDDRRGEGREVEEIYYVITKFWIFLAYPR